LLGLSNKEEKPFAEYWLGAHPNAPALLEDEHKSLLEFIRENKEDVLGTRVASGFGSLPYLFKILDVRQMLSIQVHPSKQSAIEEYKKEDEKGIPLTAPNRNYKDQNHKPELMAALSDFWLLHGFKNEAALQTVFSKVPALSFLDAAFGKGGYKALYEEVMTMPQTKVDEVLSPLINEIMPLYENGSLQKNDEHFWAARATVSFCKDGHYDRGIFSIYLFNLLHLKEGEGIYQPAGLPHAYLEGQNVEVMAASDNVLRAGLTDKHIDVAELMKHVKFEATHPHIIWANQATEQSFDTPAKEFLLKRFSTKQAVSLIMENATIIFVYEGKGTINCDGQVVALNRGEAALVLAGQEVSVLPSSASLTFFTVTTPTDKN
ncbi:MAG TPA: mannose-6-phosphate isomerase, class I, partial [Flavisolibacter sp.]|nr:mannose-6-phosphate isomerase, class I [Flavisolibacter sp.]